MGSSIGASFREFEGYPETIGTLKDILQDSSRSVIVKHPDDIRVTKEDIIDQKIQERFGFFTKNQHIDQYTDKHKNDAFSLKSASITLFNPVPHLVNLAKNLIIPAAMGFAKIWLRLSTSNRSIEKLLVEKDIENTFHKFSENLAERIGNQSKTSQLKLNLPDLLDIQRTLQLKVSYDQFTYGKLEKSTQEAFAKLDNAFKDQNKPGFYKDLDAHTAALIRNISHEILSDTKSGLIPAFWGDTQGPNQLLHRDSSSIKEHVN